MREETIENIPESGLQILNKECKCGSSGYYRHDPENDWQCCNYYDCEERLPADYEPKVKP